ncbi:MAG: T9SS type A sorting domain-containing protein [Bacteroidota bacterium]
MKKIYSLLFELTGLILAANAQTAGDYRSAATGNWSDAANWERFNGAAWVAAPSAPASSDGVISILSGHTITINSTVTADQVVVNTGSVLDQQSDLNLDNGAGNDLTVNGIWNVSGVVPSLSGPGNAMVGATGIVNFTMPAFLSMGASVTSSGTMNWQDGALFFNAAAATMTNSGTMNISGNNPFQNNPGPGTFINTGTITKTSTGTTMITLSTFSNSGTINVNGGTIDCGDNFTNTGTVAFNGGNWLQSQGIFNHNAASIINGTGHFSISSNAALNLNINQTFPSTLVFTSTGTISGAGNLTINNDFTFGGTIGGSGTLTINASSTWNDGSLDRALIIPATRTLTLTTGSNKSIGASITNNGTISWQDGALSITVAATVTNNGAMNISGNGTFQNSPGPGTFINNGIMTKNSAGTTIFAMTTMTNSSGATINGLGTIEINGTTINSNGFIAPGLSPGLLTIDNNQPLSANSTLSIEMLNGSGAGTGHDQLIRNGDITLAGMLTVTETGSVPPGTYTIINLLSGTVSGSFATTNLPSNYTLQVNASSVAVVKSSPLPLHFISFTAQKTTDNKVKLHWVTADEQNVSHFEVQRSADGVNYVRIAVVQALNSPNGGTYHYRDESPLTRANHYRLLIVDTDASFQLSPVRRISIDKLNYSLSVYPNPAKDFIQVDFSSNEKKIRVRIFDAAGRLMLSKLLNNELLITIPVQSLSAGTYYLHVSDGIQEAKQVFVKQ